MRIVLDTNIVIDLLHFADPSTQTIEESLNSGRSTCFTDDECLVELERVVTYPQLALELPQQRVLLADYRRLAMLCNADGNEDYALPRCRDVDDQKFLLLAARSGADLLITRDKLLLRLCKFDHGGKRCRIVTAQSAGALI